MIPKRLMRPASKHLVNLERERLNSLINSMADGVIAIDEKGKIVVYNGAALNILDLNSSVTGVYLAHALKLIDKNNQDVDTGALINDTLKATTSRDYRLKYKDNSTINLYISVAPVHLGYGQMGAKGHVVLLRDITNEKALEEERDDFISVVSHELRTPIAIAEGSISNAQFIVSAKADPAKIKVALDRAHGNVIFLSDMVNDLSTLSRADGIKLKFELDVINVHQLVEDLVRDYRSQAENKGLQLHSDIDPTLEILHSSHLYVREILQNFITNSVKYTEAGSVTVGAKAAPKGVLFTVTDTGIGISVADREKIFDKFFRSSDSRAQQSSGKGLGLYITLKLARLLHAELDVDSELNKGTTFSIFVPNLDEAA